jgi:hypothetical protein
MEASIGCTICVYVNHDEGHSDFSLVDKLKIANCVIL